MNTTSVLILLFLVLVTDSVHASIFVEARPVDGTQFSISGSVNPLALTYRAGPFVGAATGIPEIDPTLAEVGFGGNGSLGLNATVYNLPNLVGPSAFGAGQYGFNPDQYTGTNFIDIIVGGESGTIVLDQYSANGATLDDTMAFTRYPSTYFALGLTPGSYHWSWSNGDATDSLTLQIDAVPEPTTLTLVALGGMAALLVPLAGRGRFHFNRGPVVMGASWPLSLSR
jgi:hypothetical protein